MDKKEPDFVVKIWRNGQKIDLRHLGSLSVELRPIELHIKEEGDINDNPSLCYVMKDVFGRYFHAQISQEMLLKGLEEASNLQENKK